MPATRSPNYKRLYEECQTNLANLNATMEHVIGAANHLTNEIQTLQDRLRHSDLRRPSIGGTKRGRKKTKRKRKTKKH
tara:strand:+ start:72 stop:305 length:234 start_codon:yes stop_codon:yes gene_type:complete